MAPDAFADVRSLKEADTIHALAFTKDKNLARNWMRIDDARKYDRQYDSDVHDDGEDYSTKVSNRLNK